MALPLYLAMTGREISETDTLPPRLAWMACHFSPLGPGVSDLPQTLPAGAMLILNDRLPCASHSPDLIAEQLAQAVVRLRCESVLLDFQRPPELVSTAIVQAIVAALPCPTAVSDGFAAKLDCPVFLAPGPLHQPLAEHLAPWKGRGVWLEAALQQQTATVTQDGTAFASKFPPEGLTGGWYAQTLRCRCRTEISADAVQFTLFDTRQSLAEKLALAESLGVTRTIGLYQELGNYQLK